MRNLLSAGFSRLCKDKIFVIGVVAMLALSLATTLQAIGTTMDASGEGVVRILDDTYFWLAPMMSLFCSAFVGLFIGTEYADGTMRNKIVVGRTRTQIYLSNYIVCTAANLCFVAVWLVSGLIGIPYLGIWNMGVQNALLYMLTAVCFTAALTGIFTLLSMLFTNKAFASVAAVLLALGLLAVASWFYSKLGEPEFNNSFLMTADGMQMGEPYLNPNYVTGTKRIVYQFIVDFLPTGQGIQMANLELFHPLLSMASSACIAAVTTLAGVFVFRKKDLQ